MGKKSKKAPGKFRRKVSLPVDRNKVPIEVGDYVAWDDGSCFKVQAMTWMGGKRQSWILEGEDPDADWSDNPGGGEVVFKVPKHG